MTFQDLLPSFLPTSHTSLSHELRLMVLEGISETYTLLSFLVSSSNRHIQSYPKGQIFFKSIAAYIPNIVYVDFIYILKDPA